MNEKAKSVTILLIGLLVIALGAAGTIFYSLQNEQKKNTALQAELEDVKTKQRVTESKLEESKKMINALEAKVKENLSQIESLGKDLDQEKATKEEALNKIERMAADLEQQKTLRSDLENKLTQVQSESKKIQEQLTTLESKKTELEAKVKELQEKSQGVELGKIVVSPEVKVTPLKEKPKPVPAKKQKKEAILAPSALEGRVLVVNKDYNFAVINLGSKESVNIGDVFSLYQGNKYLGDVKVEKVHDSMSAAGFLSDSMKDKVSEGDKVVKKK